MSDLTGKATGKRVKHFRNRVGMTRPVLGGLVVRSAEWVKAVETGRLQVPRLRANEMAGRLGPGSGTSRRRSVPP